MTYWFIAFFGFQGLGVGDGGVEWIQFFNLGMHWMIIHILPPPQDILPFLFLFITRLVY